MCKELPPLAEKYRQWLAAGRLTECSGGCSPAGCGASDTLSFAQVEKTSAAATSSSAGIRLRKSNSLNFNQSVFRKAGYLYGRTSGIVSGTEYFAVNFVHFGKIIHVA